MVYKTTDFIFLGNKKSLYLRDAVTSVLSKNKKTGEKAE